MAAAEAEDRKSVKYRDLINDGFIFQSNAFKVQGAADSNTEICLNKLCKNLVFLSRDSPWKNRLRMPLAYSA